MRDRTERWRGLALAALAIVLVGAASTRGAAAQSGDSRLDARLRLIDRVQREAASAARLPGADVGRQRVDALVARLRADGRRGGDRARSAALAVRLPVLVSSTGDCRALEAAGLRLQAQVGSICTGSVEPELLAALGGAEGVRFVQSSALLRALPSARPSPGRLGAITPASDPRGNVAVAPALLSGAGVIVAFIDTGVDVFHQDFRRSDGSTRIKYLLDLSDPGDVDADGDLDGSGPYGGTLYSEAQINAALTSSGLFNEKDTTGHGTHGLSIAAGDDPALPGLAPAADLIVVKATRDDGTLGFVSSDVVNALAFVDQKAGELGKPYVVNLSLGTLVASHDGRSLEEQALDEIFGPGRPGKAAVLAAGNSSDNRPATRFHHFRGVSYVGLTTTHTLKLPAYTPTPGAGNDRVLVDLWYRGRDQLTITVTPPGGSPVAATFGSYLDLETPQGNVFVANLGGPSLENGDVEAFVLVDDWAGTPPAAGNWTIAVTGEQVTDGGVYDGWLADDSAVGALAPYFSANADNRLLVGKPGTAQNGITVGAFARHDAASRFRTTWTDLNGQPRSDNTAVAEAISEFSSPGPTRDGRTKPELAAPGERVLGALSREAHPCRSPYSIYRYHGFAECDALLTEDAEGHGFGLLQGTSFAAPVVTGLAARVLGTNPSLDAIQVRNVLVNSALADSFTGAVPNEVWGYGKADLGVGGPTLPADLRITTDALPEGALDQDYRFALTASGGRLPYAWALDSGSLPSGLALDARGQIGGRPTSPGTSTVTVRVTDASGPAQSLTRTFPLTVLASPPLEVVTRALPPVHVGVAYAERLEARGGTGPYTWLVVGGALPAGLTLQADGAITGGAGLVGRYDFTVEARDAVSASARASVRVKVTRAGAELWDPLGIILTSVNHVVVDPKDPRHLFASTENTFDKSQHQAYESLDGGESWKAISINDGYHSAFANNTAKWLAVSPAGKAWAITDNSPQRVLRYEDAGGWVDTNPCSYPSLDALAFDSSGAAYLLGNSCGSNGAFVRSTDAGASWQAIGTLCGGAISEFGYRGSLSISASSPNVVYATRAGLRDTQAVAVTCRSADGGQTWQQSGATLSNDEYYDVQVSAANPLDVVRMVEVFPSIYAERSSDGGQTWSSRFYAGSSFFNRMVRSSVDPAVLLLGTSSGLRRSSDGGQTWASVPVKGYASLDVASLAFDPTSAQRFYVGSPAGLFYTADGGQTWTAKNRGLQTRGLTRIAINQQSPAELMLGTTAGDVFLSRTAGERWTRTSVGVVNNDTAQWPIISGANPSRYFLVANAISGLLRSDDKGLTWRSIRPSVTFGGSVYAADADPFDEDAAVIAIAGGDLYRTTDGGQGWNLVLHDPFLTGKQISFARDVPGRVFAALGYDGVYRSDDGGASWSASFALPPTNVTAVAPAPSDSRRVYAAVGGTVYYRDPSCGYPCADEAQRWHPATVGPAAPVLSLAVDWGNPLVAYAGADHPGTGGGTGGFYKTVDGGLTWVRPAGALDGFDVTSVATHPTAPGSVYAVTLEGGVFRSADGGATWAHLDQYGSVGEVVNVTLRHPSLSSFVLVGTEGYGVQVSSDGGRTFASRVTGLTNFNVNALAFEPGSSTVLYAGTDAGIFKSVDTGSTWAPTGLGSGEISDLASDNEGAIRRIWGTVRGQGVAYSADGGATFTVYASGLASLDLTSIELETVGSVRRIWGTTRGGDGVVYSDDLGQTWKPAGGNGLADRDVTDFSYESSSVRRIWGTVRRIWATTGSGAFYSDNDGLSWTELSLGLPSGAPVSSVSIDPNSNEVMVSLFSNTDGGVFRGANLNGIWSPFNDGLDELKVNRLTNDSGRVVDATTRATTFYVATAGDGSYASEVRTPIGNSPAITTTALPAGTLHGPYTRTLVASGGSPPYAWSVPEGYLPPGLQIAPATGVISGEPGRPGSFVFSVQVADANGRLDRRPFTLEIVDPSVPAVVSFSPAGGLPGSSVTVAGTSFLGATAVAFGGVLATSFTVESGNSIAAAVPAGARTGPISVTNASGTGRSAASFAVFVSPSIASFSPTSGPVGASLTITGTAFGGATAVRFNGVAASSFTVDSAVQITATVPAGATTGPISVTTPGGTATSASSFAVIPAPTILSFAPTSGPVGASVTITGTAFVGATSVRFNGVTAPSFTVVSTAQITTIVPAGATTGPISVVSPGGTATSASSFSVLLPGLGFYTLTPCRLVDTRLPDGSLGGPALRANQDRSFTLLGACGVPLGAQALSLNITVTAPTTNGHLRLYPEGAALPTVSSINYAAGLTRANNAVAVLGADGRLNVYCSQASGTTHLVLDVNGYFR